MARAEGADLTTGDTRVCPRCGEPAGDGRYCSSCGLELATQRELPTLREWNDRGRAEPAVTPTPAISTEPSIASPDERVCPDCGRSPGGATFCGHCGLNLGSVERLPTHDEWRRRSTIAGDLEAQAIAARMAAISEPAFTGLSSVRASERHFDNSAVAQIAERAIVGELKSSLARLDRASGAVIETRATAIDSKSLRVVATVALTDGARIEQAFMCALPPGRLRLAVALSGDPTLFRGMSTSVIAVDQSATQPPQHVNVAATAPSQRSAPLSSDDAKELAARRARDARLEAKLHGWNPLPLWYSFWCLLFGIGAIVGLAKGQVVVFLVGAGVCALCAKYAHYLYHGGRRRVWFIFW